jgi:hypothetical protein
MIVGFEVPVAVAMKNIAFWVAIQCSSERSRTVGERFIFFLQYFFLISIVGRGEVGVQLGPLGTTATNRPTVPVPVMYKEKLVE